MAFYNRISPTLLAVIAIGLCIVAFGRLRRYLARREMARRHGCKPVAHACNYDPVFGIDIMYSMYKEFRAHKILEGATGRFEKYGHTFMVRDITREVIVTIEPENLKTVQSIKFKDYDLGHRLELFQPLLGAGIFDTDGDHWAASRALIRPNFNRDQVADLTSFEALIQDLFAHLPRDGKTSVDLQDLFFRYTIDSATEFLFGQSAHTLKPDSQSDFADAFDYAQRNIIVRLMLGRWAKLYRDRRATESNRICRDFAKRFVDEAINAVEAEKKAKGGKEKLDDEEADKGNYVFSHALAWRTSDRQRILDELMNVLLAGRDTTASLLSNMFFVLAKHPDKWQKLRQEVASLEGRPPTYEELRNLRYVQNCMHEALRLYPVVPRNQRMAVRDTVLPVGGGKDGRSPVLVPEGALVTWNLYAMHRRQDTFGPDAEEYRPERWDDPQLRPRWEYLPFNGGPRICVGQRYALTEVGYVLVRMVQEFQKVESSDPGPWEESVTLTLCSRNGAKVVLTPA